MNQLEWEARYSQRNIHTVLHKAIEYELDKCLINWALQAYYAIDRYLDGKYYNSKNARIDELVKDLADKGMDQLVVAIAAAVLRKRTDQTIQEAVGYLQTFLPHEDAFNRARTAAELLAVCQKGLYKIQRNGTGVSATIKVKHWPIIESNLLSAFEWINNTLYNPPLVEPPLEVTHNKSCGYHALREPLLLGSLVQHDEKQNYANINALNSIEWVLDQDVLQENEVPSKPFESIEQKLQFNEMVRDSQFIYSQLGTEPFWLTWQYDSRGRSYSHGYHVNLQSFEYKKALLNFNKFEDLT